MHLWPETFTVKNEHPAVAGSSAAAAKAQQQQQQQQRDA